MDLLIREGLKSAVKTEGVWRIRRLDRSSVIEVFQLEGSGTGQILTEDFKAWREQL